MTLSDEIERLDGPSREMDVRIALAAGWDLPGGGLRPYADLVAQFGMDWAVSSADEYVSTYRALPRYTASFDAAMTLVPEGWFPIIDCASESRVKNVLCDLWRDPPDIDAEVRMHASAATPALALAAASIRARTEEKGHG